MSNNVAVANFFYIFEEDFVNGLVGPFSSREDATKHIQVVQHVLKGGHHEVVSGRVTQLLQQAGMDDPDIIEPDEHLNFRCKERLRIEAQ